MGNKQHRAGEPNTAPSQGQEGPSQAAGEALAQPDGAQPQTAPQDGPTAPAGEVKLPAPYGVAQFSRPDREVTAKRGGTLVTRVRLTIPGAGIAVDAAVWANPRKDGGRDYSVSLPSYVRAMEPLVEGSRTDNPTTGAVKDAIITAWYPWFKATEGQTKATASEDGGKAAVQFGRFTPPAE